MKRCSGGRISQSGLRALALTGRHTFNLSWIFPLAGNRSSSPGRRQKICSSPCLRISRFQDIPGKSLGAVENQCLYCGKIILDLRTFILGAYARPSLRCTVAVSSVLEDVLTLVQGAFSQRRSSPTSMLQLQAAIRRLSALLSCLEKLSVEVQRASSDEDILEVTFAQARAADLKGCHLRDMMRRVLQRVSVPWIDFLAEWTGTKSGSEMALGPASVGVRNFFIKVDSVPSMDDAGAETEDIDYVLAEDHILPFMPRDLVMLVFETGRSLRFIKSHHPDHFLTDIRQASLQAPDLDWVFDWPSVLNREETVRLYHETLVRAVQEPTLGTAGEKEQPQRQDRREAAPNSPSIFFGVDEDDIDAFFQISVEKTGQKPEINEDGALGLAVRNHLHQGTLDDTTGLLDETPHWSLLPLLSFGGVISVQAQVVSRESLRLLFSEHSLRKHVNLMRSFSLMGDRGILQSP